MWCLPIPRGQRHCLREWRLGEDTYKQVVAPMP